MKNNKFCMSSALFFTTCTNTTVNFRNRPDYEYVRVGDDFIAPKLSVRNLGVIMDNCFCMEQHVKKICSEANYHLSNISKIRKYLTLDSAQILIHAFISSKLDYCNSLLYGIASHFHVNKEV